MRLSGSEAERAQACGEPLALLEHRRRVGTLGERRDREGRGQRRDGGRRLAAVQLVRRLTRGERVSDARAREAEQFRERAQDDHTVVEQVERRHAAVLEVGLVDDQRTRVRQRPELAGRVVRPAGEGEHRVDVSDLGARELRRDAKERVGRRGRDGDRVAGPRISPRAEQDQVVGARAEHDVLRLHTGVVRDRAAQLAVAARAGSR